MATQAVTCQTNMSVSAVQTVNTGVITNYTIPATVVSNFQYTNATTGAGTCDQLYEKQLTLAAAATTISLQALTDPAGNTINMARVREFIVTNLSTTAGQDVKVEAGTTNGWSVLPPSTQPLYARAGNTTAGGFIRISDYASSGASNGNVTATGSLNVTFDPGANTVSINVLILGNSVV